MAFDFDDLAVIEAAVKYDAELTTDSFVPGEFIVQVHGGLSGDDLCSVAVNLVTSIRALKTCIASRSGIPASEQTLLLNGVQLCDHELLSDVLTGSNLDCDFAIGLLRADPARSKVIQDVMSGEVRLKNVADKFRGDVEVVLAALALASDESTFQYAGPPATQHREVALRAVRQCGANLRLIPEEFQRDRDIILAALRMDGHAFRYVPVDLSREKEFALAAVAEDGLALRLLPKEFKSDHAVVTAAVECNGEAFEFASEYAKGTCELVLVAVARSAKALSCAADSLLCDRDFILSAVTVNGLALQYVPAAMQRDREVVMSAVSQNGLALAYAAIGLEREKEIVLVAVRERGLALKHAALSLQDDRQVVRSAVANRGIALQYASERLRDDCEIVCTAVEQDCDAVNFVGEEAVIDPVFRAKATELGVFQSAAADMFMSVRPEAAFKVMEKGMAVFIDARTGSEFNSSHVRGAISLPVGDIVSLNSAFNGGPPADAIHFTSSQEFKSLTKEDSQVLAFVYSDQGLEISRDAFLAQTLRGMLKAPRQVLRMRGGLNAWKAKGYPVDGDTRSMLNGVAMDMSEIEMALRRMEVHDYY